LALLNNIDYLELPVKKNRPYSIQAFAKMYLNDDEELLKDFEEINKQWNIPLECWRKRANYVSRQYSKCTKDDIPWAFGFYIRMYKEQKGMCLVCDKNMRPLTWGGANSKYTAAIDHNHGSNEIRALLCYRCNMCLGACRESRGVLAKMIWYLDEYGNNSEEESDITT